MKLKKLTKDLLIIDVEATCWDSDIERKDQENEVIEIGYCLIKNMEPSIGHSIIIKPRQSTVSEFCTKLTTITQQQVNNGIPPAKAYNQLKSMITSPWGSWGRYDHNILKSMCELYNFPDFIPSNHINVRELYANKIMKNQDPKAAPNNPYDACEKLKIKWEGTNHRGDSDAYNIARIYLKLVEIPN
jgi:inhibitor of KinA sporulation pathway (predicted exonuclease)